MNRSTLDKLISFAGLIIATVLLAAAGGLFYTYQFVHSQVNDQLAEQKITFPRAGSKQIESLPEASKKEINKYAGQQLLTGAQAKAFADHYIAVHLDKSTGGKTYSELSTASLANPSDTKLAAQVQTSFRGETLRGLLLNAYAFDTMAIVAKYAASVAIVASLIFFTLAWLGFLQAGYAARAKGKKR